MRLSLNVDQETFDTAGQANEPVPAGTYNVSVFEIGNGTVQSGDNKGKPRLKFQFRIEDGEESPDGKNQGNRRLFSDVNAFEGFSAKTNKATPPYDLLAIAKALGVSAEELADVDTDDWQGEHLQVTVIHKKKQHQVDGAWVDIEPAEYRAVVKSYRSLDSANTSAAATAAVLGKAPAAGKAKAATGAKFKL